MPEDKDSQISRARVDFELMDTYARGCIASGGTAFTTYEDSGKDYCIELNRLAAEWRASEIDEPSDRVKEGQAAELEGPVGPEDSCQHTKSIGPNILLDQPDANPGEPRLASVIELHKSEDKPSLTQALESVMRPVTAMAEFYGCRVMVAVISPDGSFQFKSSLDLTTAIGLLHRMSRRLENQDSNS